MSESVLGADWAAFFGLTVLLFGAAAMASGRAIARHWRPLWQTLPYAMLLAAADRFLLYAVFEGELLSVSGFVIGWAILLVFALLAYRATHTRLMVRQYPWLYEPAGLLSWRERR